MLVGTLLHIDALSVVPFLFYLILRNSPSCFSSFAEIELARVSLKNVLLVYGSVGGNFAGDQYLLTTNLRQFVFSYGQSQLILTLFHEAKRC